MSGLNVAPGFTLPRGSVTESFALLAKRGAGKSNAAVAIAEEMHDGGIPWVAVDPKGDWWGIRSSVDGKGPGLPIPIFGGHHGDVPLDAAGGTLIADLIVAENLTCVLDVSTFPSKAAMLRFLHEFGEHLFRLHGRDPQPRHLFLDEADEFIPQRIVSETGNLSLCVGTWSKIVKQGRNRGFGVTLISQRSAVVNKDVLSQTETMIALRTTAKLDRDAIRGWVDYHDTGAEVVAELPTLANGEAWVISPSFLQDVRKIRFRQRRTFDSGATPELGKTRKVATMADIDLGAVRESMSSIVAEVEANDPKALRRRVAELERELAERPPATVEVPVLCAEDLDVIVSLAKDVAPVVKLLERIVADHPGAKPWPGPVADIRFTRLDDVGAPTGPTVGTSRTPTATAPRTSTARSGADPAGSDGLSPAETALLTVLVQYRTQGRTVRQAAVKAGYSPRSSTVTGALAGLRAKGFITRGQPMYATDEGVDALGPVEPLPSGAELLAYWLDKLERSEAVILQAMVDRWPDAHDKETLAAATGYSPTSSSVTGALAQLRSLQMIDGWRAHPDFMEAIR